MSAIIKRIEELVKLEFDGTSCFLVDIKAGANNKIQVFIDCEEHVTIDRCTTLSRLLEKHLEEEGLVGEKYILEVSSPGIDNPFKVLDQYHKNKGRLVEVLLTDGVKKEGLLVEVQEDGLVLEEVVAKKGKGKKKNKSNKQVVQNDGTKQLHLLFSNIKYTKEKIVF